MPSVRPETGAATGASVSSSSAGRCQRHLPSRACGPVRDRCELGRIPDALLAVRPVIRIESGHPVPGMRTSALRCESTCDSFRSDESGRPSAGSRSGPQRDSDTLPPQNLLTCDSGRDPLRPDLASDISTSRAFGVPAGSLVHSCPPGGPAAPVLARSGGPVSERPLLRPSWPRHAGCSPAQARREQPRRI